MKKELDITKNIYGIKKSFDIEKEKKINRKKTLSRITIIILASTFVTGGYFIHKEIKKDPEFLNKVMKNVERNIKIYK